MYSIEQIADAQFLEQLKKEPLPTRLRAMAELAELASKDEFYQDIFNEFMEAHGKEYTSAEYYNKSGKKMYMDISLEDLEGASLDSIKEKPIEWLIQGWIPKGCVTLLCSDGGIGKTTVWCDVLASMTRGKPTIFDKTGTGADVFPEQLEKHEVVYFSKEDSTDSVLVGKLKRAGADLSKINTIPLDDERISKIWYGSPLLELFIEKYRPSICVFDTLQAFLPDGVEMSKRKDMRDALNHLSQLGAKYGTAFLMIMHTNKSANSGRQRMADSSDIWDLGRSAIMAGRTKDKNICYLSQEKCNYGQLQTTILFSVTDNGIEYNGTTWKKDRDYVQENGAINVATPKKDEAKAFILDAIMTSENKAIQICDLERDAKAAGIAHSTLQDARAEMKADGEIKSFSTGFGSGKKHFLTVHIESNPK